MTSSSGNITSIIEMTLVKLFSWFSRINLQLLMGLMIQISMDLNANFTRLFKSEPNLEA